MVVIRRRRSRRKIVLRGKTRSRKKRRSRSFTARDFFFGDIPGLTKFTFPLGGGGAGGLLGSAPRVARATRGRRFAREILPFVRGLNVGLGKAFKSVGKGIGRITGVAPFSPLRLGLTGIVGAAAKESPRFRRGLTNIPRSIGKLGTEAGRRIEERSFTPSGISPLGVLGAGLLGGAGGLGLGGLISAIRGRRDRQQPITIVGGAVPALPPIVSSGTDLAPRNDDLLTPIGTVTPPQPTKAPTKSRRRAKKAQPITNIIQIQNSIGI